MLEQNDTTKTLALNTTIDKDDAKEKDIRYTEVIGILKDIDILILCPIFSLLFGKEAGKI